MSELGLLRYPMTITNDHQRDQLIESMRLKTYTRISDLRGADRINGTASSNEPNE